MTANKNGLGNTNSGGASNSASQNPIDFLKGFNGKKVKVKAKGVFVEDLIGRFGKVLKTEVFNGYMEGKYRVQLSAFGDVLLRYPYHIIEFKKIEWIEIDGKRVESD